MALAGDRNPLRPFHGSYRETAATPFANLFSFNPSPCHQNPSHDHSTSARANSSSHGGASMNRSGSFLSFETHQPCYDFGQSESGFGGGGFRVLGDTSRLQVSGSGGALVPAAGERWAAGGGDRESAVEQQTSFRNKRPLMEESIQTLKKPKHSYSSNDTQSLSAKNRRGRISERLKILQDLVPNGSKVDMVTMLEKAISYVKFLQLQIKVLATDEFWPESGGKLPDIGQVREAVDAILSCRREGLGETCSD